MRLEKEYEDAIAKAANLATPVIGGLDLGRPYARENMQEFTEQIDFVVSRLLRIKDTVCRSAGMKSALLPLMRDYMRNLELRAQARWLEAQNGGIDEKAYNQLSSELQEVYAAASAAMRTLGKASVAEGYHE